ncbi:lipopolysaccharide biosynthesis protein [Nocardioides mesophilus]|uniref:Lipopolysaccharide biosynthesis protein n=1 Tax=Nocardioides mesophilus TaxID=433659 RepID=A0A7G9REL0_9ACTN|nr:lipopolysaccharide biosynthesis protein [Nocardioides mesophilus]QNN54035.1 lipopolysaccharide biosynthesis protein [Nocardioides mesophilus]
MSRLVNDAGRPTRPRLSVLGALVWYALSYGGSVLGYLAINAFAARLLDDSFGYFVVAISTATALGQLGLIGAHRGGLREAARLETGDVEGLRDLRRGVRAVSRVTLPVTSLLTAAVTFGVMNDSDPAYRGLVAVLTGILVWFGGQQKLWASYSRGFGNVRLASLLEGRSGGALVSLCQGVLVGVCLMFVPELGLPGALAAMALGFALPVFIAKRRVARVWRGVRAEGSVLADVRLVVSRHWRFAVNMLGTSVNGAADVWVAGVVLTGSGVALFGAAQRLSLLLVIPLAAVGVIFSPVISRLYGKDDPNLERLLRTGASLAAAATAVLWLPMLLLPGPLLAAIYGDFFRDAAPLLLLLTLGSVSNVLTGMCGIALTMSRHEAVVAKVQVFSAAVRVGAGFVAAWQFGAVGLAVCTATISTVSSFTLWVLARRRMGLSTHLTLRPAFTLMRRTEG